MIWDEFLRHFCFCDEGTGAKRAKKSPKAHTKTDTSSQEKLFGEIQNSFLGTNSLVIFVFQEPVYRAVIFIFSKILKTNVEILRTNIFWCISMAIISILIIIPIIYAYNKWVNPQLKRIKL